MDGQEVLFLEKDLKVISMFIQLHRGDKAPHSSRILASLKSRLGYFNLYIIFEPLVGQ